MLVSNVEEILKDMQHTAVQEIMSERLLKAGKKAVI